MTPASFVFTAQSLQAPPPPDPAGEVRTVRRWDDPVMQAAGFSTENRGNVGQFQVVTTYPVDGAGQWIGTWSAISNKNRLTHGDMMRIANLQLLDFGYPHGMSDAELLAVKDKPLRDGYTLGQKMGWLYFDLSDGGRPSCELFGNGEWWATTDAAFGMMVNGGQKVAVGERKIFTVQMPQESAKRAVPMRELVPFRRADFGKQYQTHPYLIQRATVANHPGSRYGDYPRGYVYVPVVLHAGDFPAFGTFQPARYYLPESWLV